MYGYGLVGCGRFGEFCWQALDCSQVVQVRAVSDANAEQARWLSELAGVPALTFEQMLESDDVDVLHLATPPGTHHSLASRALAAGKHVLIEKPFCLTLDQADDLLERAAVAKRRLAVDHLLRYNPLVEHLARLLHSGVLGRPLRAWVENYACDERLPDGHWFWDQSKSGGIFIEHATHFFDLHQWWFGCGEILSAQALKRGEKVDRVFSQATHGEVLASGYHGFDQADRMDRAEHRIVCEHGELRLFGWIPMRLEAEGLFEEPPEGFETVESYPEPEQSYRCRGQERRCRVRGRLVRALERERSLVYQDQFRHLLEDQLVPETPRLTAWDAREALRMAVQATSASR